MSNQQTREFGIPSSADPHPLEAVVLQIFAEHEARGVTALCLGNIATGLAGPIISSPRNHKFYLVVAEDVMNYMTAQGKLVLNVLDQYGEIKEWRIRKIGASSNNSPPHATMQ